MTQEFGRSNGQLARTVRGPRTEREIWIRPHLVHFVVNSVLGKLETLHISPLRALVIFPLLCFSLFLHTYMIRRYIGTASHSKWVNRITDFESLKMGHDRIEKCYTWSPTKQKLRILFCVGTLLILRLWNLKKINRDGSINLVTINARQTLSQFRSMKIRIWAT